jgi:hypothetical protein
LPFTLYREDQEDDLSDEPMEPENTMSNIENTEAYVYDSLLFTDPAECRDGE